MIDRVIDRVVIVGASLAGLRAAETLRQKEFDGEVVVVGAESHRPYDRPPLSKKLLSGEWEPDRIHLRQPDTFDDLDVTWELGIAATELDVERRQVGLDDGRRLDFDGLIIATGATPRRLGDAFDLDERMHELRTVDDALRLRAELESGTRRVVVIGAGFIGLEVAATARQFGNDVVVLEFAESPLIRGLGVEMGEAIGALHRAKGVDVRCGVTVEGFTDKGVQISGCSDDTIVTADVIVVGIGVSPATRWLEGSGLELRDGVVCDETLRALPSVTASVTEPVISSAKAAGTAPVFAAGDVARWPNRLFGHEMRVEHWTNAAEQGAHAAANLLALGIGEPLEAYAPVPFFWSDQFEHRIQFLGHALPGDQVCVVAGSVADGKFLALYGSDDRLHGALGLNAPRWVMPTRRLLLDQVPWTEALDIVRASVV